MLYECINVLTFCIVILTVKLVDVKCVLFTDLERQILYRLNKLEETQASLMALIERKFEGNGEITAKKFPRSESVQDFKIFCADIDADDKKCIVSNAGVHLTFF